MADPIITPPTQTTTPVSPVPETVQAAPAPVTVQTTPSGSSKGMMWVILAAFLVVAILVAVGIYLYMQAKDSNPAFQQISQSVRESLTSAENDLSGVNVDDASADFSEVDKDLNSL